MTTTIHLTADNFNGSRDFFDYRDPLPENLRDMTQERWNLLSNAQREAMRDNSHLSPQLIGLEGWRVEAVDVHGERRRFIVGKSTGWRPCHLEIKTARAACGDPARARYQSVKALDGSVAKIVKLEHAWRRLDGRNDDGFQVAPFPG